MQFEWISPPSDLNHLVHSFYRTEIGAEGLDEPTPAYSAQLTLAINGGVELEYAHGGSVRAHGLFLNAPQLQAGRIRIRDPYRAVGASLTPLGWAALTGSPVDETHDCLVSPALVASPDLLSPITSWLGQASGDAGAFDQALAFLQAILRAAAHPIKPRDRQFVTEFTAWLASDLNPSLKDLHERISLSERQIQRLSRRFFGAAPTQVLLRHRAIRIAMLLSNSDLPRELYDELGAAYFDQAHMIRHVRRFTGRTPSDFSGRFFTRKSLNPKGHGATAQTLRKG
jgi:AraC-like DNA-binding protein